MNSPQISDLNTALRYIYIMALYIVLFKKGNAQARERDEILPPHTPGL
jgi:hypothetical protein